MVSISDSPCQFKIERGGMWSVRGLQTLKEQERDSSASPSWSDAHKTICWAKNISTLCLDKYSSFFFFFIESTSLASKSHCGFDWTRLEFLSEPRLLTIELAFPFAKINVDLFSPKFYRCQKKKPFTALWRTLAFFSRTSLAFFCSSFKFPLSRKLTIRSSISVRNIELLSSTVNQPRTYET